MAASSNNRRTLEATSTEALETLLNSKRRRTEQPVGFDAASGSSSSQPFNTHALCPDDAAAFVNSLQTEHSRSGAALLRQENAEKLGEEEDDDDEWDVEGAFDTNLQTEHSRSSTALLRQEDPEKIVEEEALRG